MPTTKQRGQRGPYRVGPPAQRGCWTCRDRKISCDLRRPGCRKCEISARRCEGYGLRLSWPAQGSRRSIEHLAQLINYPNRPGRSNGDGDVHFVNAFAADIELFYLQDPQLVGQLQVRNIDPLPRSNLAKAWSVVGDGNHLMTFFMNTVVGSLTLIRTDGHKLWQLLFKLSFSDDSPASMAVLRAILSLAYLYRYGHGKESLRLKVAALNSLGKAMKEQVTGTREVYQHVAVGMLLCAFEIFIPTESSFQWPLYLSGAKSMLHSICEAGHPKLTEVEYLVLWVHYHDILGKFISRHWRVKSAENESLFKVPGMASNLVSSIARNQVLGIFGCSIEMINLISEISKIELDEVQAMDHKILDSLEHRLISIEQDITHISEIDSAEEVEHGSKISDLYQLATLIYFERALKKSPTDGRVARWTTEAFGIIQGLETCERPFPLFFIACEAHTDTQRDMILSLLEKTQRKSSQRTLSTTKSMIESVWVQKDLSSDEEGMNYVDMLNAVISSYDQLPTLA